LLYWQRRNLAVFLIRLISRFISPHAIAEVGHLNLPSDMEMADWAHDEEVDYTSRTYKVANWKINRWREKVVKVRQQTDYLSGSRLYVDQFQRQR